MQSEFPGSSLEPYSQTIEDRLTGDLRHLIVSGEYEPGRRLQYRNVAERFGVSITPVRAALRVLANEGLVDIRPNIGARVAELSLDELEQVYLVRIGLEPWLARLGAPRLSDAQLDGMKACLSELDVFTHERDLEGTLNEGWRLREVCYSVAQRERIFMTTAALFNRARRYNRKTLLTPSRFDEIRLFAHDFYEACLDRDGERASIKLREALERSFETIIENLEIPPPES